MDLRRRGPWVARGACSTRIEVLVTGVGTNSFSALVPGLIMYVLSWLAWAASLIAFFSATLFSTDFFLLGFFSCVVSSKSASTAASSIASRSSCERLSAVNLRQYAFAFSQSSAGFAGGFSSFGGAVGVA